MIDPPKILKIGYNEPGINPFTFLRCQNKEMDSIINSGSHIVWFGYGRNAVEYALKLLEMKPGEEVLFPYYSCNVLLPVFYKFGLTVKYYHVNEKLSPDYKEMKSLISPKTRLLLVVNYFGFPQDYDTAKDFCAKYKMFFFEDNAGGFGGRYKDGLMGEFGDLSMTCTRKTLPAIDGAYLVVSNDNLLKKFNLQYPLTLIKEKRVLYRLAASFYRYFSNRATHLKKGREFVNPNYYLSDDILKNYDYTPYRISNISHYLNKRLPLSEIKNKRRELYMIWLNWLKQFPDIIPIYPELYEGVNPQCVPVYTERRNEWIEWGVKHGIDVYSWPSLSEEQQTKATLKLREKTCCFPIS